MKKFALISVPVLVALTVLLGLGVIAARPTTTWQALEQRLPAAALSAGLQTVADQTEASDRVSLPFGLRVRQLLHLDPRRLFVSGFPEVVEHYTLESARNHGRLHCLVRYSGGRVARIVVRYPAGARREAIGLRDALRQTFREDRVSLYETTDA